MAIADLNGDGRPDMAVANSGSNTVSVLLGNRDGTFGTRTDFTAGVGPSSVAIADLNGDGRSDLAVANYSGTVSVLLGNGDGTFRAEAAFDAGSGPSGLASADLNGDGRDDLIVCGFGNSLGNLSWFENQGEGNYSEHVLLNGAGAIQSFVHDWDGDGRPDIALLRGQAREGVEIFYNRGTRFEEVPVIQLPSSYGCASWQVLDFDGDGHLDLLIANGDNGDYKSKPKAYHGLRLYRGDGHGHFTEQWFYPLNGAYGVYAADFDGDGDLDIAAISYFPDYEKYPDQSFVYLRNDGDWHFQPFVLPEARQGRWLVMNAGDIDGDGDLDIVLGSFPQGPRTTFIPDELWHEWETNRVSVMILENTTR